MMGFKFNDKQQLRKHLLLQGFYLFQDLDKMLTGKPFDNRDENNINNIDGDDDAKVNYITGEKLEVN